VDFCRGIAMVSTVEFNANRTPIAEQELLSVWGVSGQHWV